MSQQTFCPGCGGITLHQNGIKPTNCCKCGMNFAFAKYSSAPAPQPSYQEPHRVKQRYIEEEDEEYFDPTNLNLRGAFKFKPNNFLPIYKAEQVVGTSSKEMEDGMRRYVNNRPLSPEEIKNNFRSDGANRDIDTSDLDRLQP